MQVLDAELMRINVALCQRDHPGLYRTLQRLVVAGEPKPRILQHIASYIQPGSLTYQMCDFVVDHLLQERGQTPTE